jgi:MFS family permease
MRFLRAFGIGLLTAIVGMFLAIFAADYLTNLYHVANMEGQRGMMVIFVFAPVGLVVGFIVGLVVGLGIRWPGFVGFIKAQGLSLLIACALAGIVSGVLFFAADKPPKIDGKELTLDFEFRLPPAIQLPAELSEYTLSASLYANRGQNRVAPIDPKSIRKEENNTIAAGRIPIVSHAANRELLVSIGNVEGGSQFIPLKLPAAPGEENETWSDWMFATRHADLTPVPDPERIAARYRVRPVD